MKDHRFRSDLILLAVLIPVALCVLTLALPTRTARAGEAKEPAKKETAKAKPEAKYREVPAKEYSDEEVKPINQCISSGTFDAADEKTVIDYYINQLKLWTHYKNRELLADDKAKIGRPRLKSDLKKAGNTEVHDKLVAALLPRLKGMAYGKDFDPVVRVNAMLMIGELHGVEASTSGTQQQCLREAIPVMLKALEDADEAVKVAALWGLQQHTSAKENPAGITDPADRQLIIKALVTLVSTPAEGTPTDGHSWMRRQAAVILGQMKFAGKSGSVALALGKMLGDKSLPLCHRCEAAENLRLNYTENFNKSPIVQALGELAIEVLSMDPEGKSPRFRAFVEQIRFGAKGVGAPKVSGPLDKMIRLLDKPPTTPGKKSPVETALDELQSEFGK